MEDRIASPPQAPPPEPTPWFRRVTFYSLLAGLCPLIPVPFLDDRVLASVKRAQIKALAAERGVALSPAQLEYLAGTYRRTMGCAARLAWALRTVTVKLLGKIVRKLLVVLAVKEGVDTASRTFHEGYLLHVLFDPAEAATAAPADDAAAWRARWAMEGAIAELDPRPVNQAVRRLFRGSRGTLRAAAQTLARPYRRGEGGSEALPEAEEEQLLGGLGDRLAADLWQERGYLANLEARFKAWLSTPDPNP